jgi:hypothetical protein
VHLLWSVNPLMLFAVVAGGHIDGLAAALGLFALIAGRRADVGRGLLASVALMTVPLRRLPAGPAGPASVRPVLALGLGWLTSTRRLDLLAALPQPSAREDG